ncbi:unnamed protein product [Heligmosomoides polygyrus]|uniref:Acyltransf_C domain-containing protein n=1 Tax=Heligmosomoides polygyrus TaxID=6339 RepID=A0A183F2Y7_HELPZ|nr:unnamed protein product [Heligmosomoides polygyrus]
MREEKSQYERKGFKEFFRKYFCEGQHLDENSSPREIPKDADFLDIVLIKYRKYVAVLIPLVVMQALWWPAALHYSWLSLFRTHWQLPAIMLLGSTVAAGTSRWLFDAQPPFRSGSLLSPDYPMVLEMFTRRPLIIPESRTRGDVQPAAARARAAPLCTLSPT